MPTPIPGAVTTEGFGGANGCGFSLRGTRELEDRLARGSAPSDPASDRGWAPDDLLFGFFMN